MKTLMIFGAALVLVGCGAGVDDGPAQGLPTGPIAYLTAPPCGADGLPTGPIAYAVPCDSDAPAVDDAQMCVMVDGEAIPVQATGMCDGKACCVP